MKWEDYIMKEGAAHEQFWGDRLQKTRNLLYVVASGFDPRMCDGAESIMKKGGDGRRDCRLVKFYKADDPTAASYSGLVEANTRKLLRLFSQQQIQTVELAPGPSKPADLQRRASEVIGVGDLETYTDIVVDISSMPTQIFFPLIGSVMHKLARAPSSSRGRLNLFVVVSENLDIDKAITKSGLDDEASFVYGFIGNMNLYAMESGPTIWIPLLGENRGRELELIHQKINPAETCPVLPSPSRDPKRGDRMLLEYRDMLRRIEMGPGNIIYASERNPFDVYRQIHDAVVHYDTVLGPLGTYKFVASPLSSKLMSIGALLAAYELTYEGGMKQGIALVGAAEYEFRPPGGARRPDLFTVWVSGECYER